ncbi:MAG: hypothetical protein K6G63_05685 [Eubacterium sp.]|nr:hypothetical protein [Eubacterium sp.]
MKLKYDRIPMFYGRLERKICALLTILFMIISLASSFINVRYTKAESAGEKVGSWDELLKALSEEDSDDEEDDMTYVEIVLESDVTWEKGLGSIDIENNMDVTIDLNGHTIDRGLSESVDDGYAIKVQSGGVLTLTNSASKAGIITGAFNMSNGGGIVCEDKSELNIEKGIKITGNHAKNGGGIYLGSDSEAYLGDVEIFENDVPGNGGGIYGGKSIITFLGGKTKIIDNTKNDEEDNDLYIPSDMEKLRFWQWSDREEKKGKKVYSEEFKRGSRIGILLQEMEKEISDGYGQCNPLEASIYFFYNTGEYVVSEDRKKSEVTIERDPEKVHDSVSTELEIYKNGKLKSREKFTTFKQAFEAGLKCDDEAIVTMGDDYLPSSEIVVGKGQEVIVDLNGHYIKRDMKKEYSTEKNGSVFHVKEDGKLTIRDSHPKKKGYDGVRGGVITGGASSNGGGGVTVDEDGTFLMEGGTIYDCVTDYNGGGVYVDVGSKNTKFTMTGGRIYHCRVLDSIDKCHGGGIYMGEGKLSIKDATIDNCYTEDNGGALFCRRGEVKLDSVKFVGNRAAKNGGAIYVDLDLKKYSGTLMYARKCIFTDNQAGQDGGALCMRDNPENKGAVTFDRCVFRGNKAEENGGAIVVIDDGLVLSNTEITGNTAGGYGGGVFVDYRYDINLKGVVVIKDNTSKKESRCNDLALEDAAFGTAYVYSGGLVRGAWIGIGSTSSKSIRLAKNITVYEMNYFHVNKGSIGAEETKKIAADMVVTASLFGTGNIVRIVLSGGVLVLAAVLLLIYGNVRRKAQAKEDESL